MIFDTHVHYNSDAFSEDRDVVIHSLQAAGVGTVVNIASDIDSLTECRELGVIHSRNAAEDTMQILQEEHGGINGGVIHCYSYSREMAVEFVKMGFHIGVGGVVTFSNSKRIKKVVQDIPIENIVLETDAPYLAPVKQDYPVSVCRRKACKADKSRKY